MDKGHSLEGDHISLTVYASISCLWRTWNSDYESNLPTHLSGKLVSWSATSSGDSAMCARGPHYLLTSSTVANHYFCTDKVFCLQ